MTDGNHANEEPTLFSAHLSPHRSLGPTGFTILLVAMCVVSFGAGVAFLMIGAWPVFGFFGLDVLLLYWAFKINYARALAFEEFAVTPSELKVRRVSHRGEEMQWSFNPLWVRLDREADEEFGLMRLFLVSRGERLAIASYLGPGEKEGFARALGAALASAKRGY